MADERDDTVDNIGSLGNSMATPQRPLSTVEEGSLDDMLATTSRDIIHAFATSIHHNGAKEAGKTEELRQELKRRLFRAIIGTYVWSTARFAHETETAEGKLVTGVQDLLSAERDQGRSSSHTPTMIDRLRARLGELMTAVSRALAMFG